MSDINWDKAPEGTTHWGADSDLYVTGWYKVNNGEQMFMRPHNFNWRPQAQTRKISELTPRPETKPISLQSNFTDGNGNEWECIKVNSDGTCVYKIVTPPIELIDGKPYLFTFGGLDLVAFYTKDLDCFGNNLATYHTSKCTNIVLLTPEGEK